MKRLTLFLKKSLHYLKINLFHLVLNYLKAFLSKGVGVIYGLILLKLLAVFLPDEGFSNYYIFYNVALYSYTIFFTIQGSAILRYYYIKGEEDLIEQLDFLEIISGGIGISEEDIESVKNAVQDWKNRVAEVEIEARREMNKYDVTIDDITKAMSNGKGKFYRGHVVIWGVSFQVFMTKCL